MFFNKIAGFLFKLSHGVVVVASKVFWFWEKLRCNGVKFVSHLAWCWKLRDHSLPLDTIQSFVTSCNLLILIGTFCSQVDAITLLWDSRTTKSFSYNPQFSSFKVHIRVYWLDWHERSWHSLEEGLRRFENNFVGCRIVKLWVTDLRK